MADENRHARVRLRDIKPYFCPDRLEDLHGPYSGRVTLPHAVRWAPGGGVADLDTYGGTRMAYQALLAEGQLDDQQKYLNARKLVEIWPYLNMDRRVRNLWEGRFPQLAAIGEADELSR
ncbi:transcriptional regulator [Bifidobacterium pseudolongum]|uniref:Transcriptional regulator n=1 Tax=Bifidobacterium pseudolongum TaxID=1694 RepID=A0A4S4FBD0_9BIFI|nr:transcriptional regulator [Bifidobacterium pseudolongum]THG27310.1 transcriptional regulator [Bifidobacterium pseudolongum]